MSRPYSPRTSAPSTPFARVNGKIRAREVRVIDEEKKQLGVMTLSDAINLARTHGVDLVEIAPNATPPVCRLIDFGKYRYELAKQEKEARKHQHANKVKELQLSPNIDPHDFGVKLQHAINFLCEEMKVKITLRFRGREMAHKEFGFQVVNRFIKALEPFAHPDADPKLIGKGINVMLSPLPRNKRAKNPQEGSVTKAELESELEADAAANSNSDLDSDSDSETETETKPPPPQNSPTKPSASAPSGPSAPNKGFGNNPFSSLDTNKT